MKNRITTKQAERKPVKKTRSRYTLKFQVNAVRMATESQNCAVAAAMLGIAVQTLHNWVKADREGKLAGAVRLNSEEVDYLLKSCISRENELKRGTRKGSRQIETEKNFLEQLRIKLENFGDPPNKRYVRQ